MLVVGALLAACAQPAPTSGPIVLAASSMQEALEAAADAWAAKGAARPVLSFAATSALARQVEAGAPGDLIVSADEEWMDRIEADGLIAPGSRHDLAGNALVLVAPAGAPVTIALAPGVDLAPLLGDGRLAIAEPETVPAGRYGKAALTALGAWPQVQDRLAIGENVRAALALVSRGEAPLGVVYATDAKAEPRVQVVGSFPTETHPPIVYPLARLATSSHPQARQFAGFLLSGEGQVILHRFGFTAPRPR
ncbi:MAG: molybdate ABC transporter substrate-binding protein [Alteraurantiacibacter sp.]